jgi:isopenicillin-N N-acyltransferase-like protein
VRAAAVYEEPIRRHAPHVMEEIQGLAEGANVGIGDILAINARTEVIWSAAAARAEGRPPAGECTSFALLSDRTASGEPLAAQTWDWLVHSFETVVVLEVEQEDHRPNFVTSVEAGLLAKLSLNSSGLAVMTNALVSRRDMGSPGVPYHVMLRLLADCESVTDAVHLVQQLPRASSANYLVVHSDDVAIDIEASPGDYSGVRCQIPDAGLLIHTNHFLAPLLRSEDVSVYAMPDTLVRMQRAQRWLGADNRLWDVDGIHQVLSDHADWPTSVCCHPDPREPKSMQWATVLAAVVEPAQRRFWLASGNPCEAPMEEVSLGRLLDKRTTFNHSRTGATSAHTVRA